MSAVHRVDDIRAMPAPRFFAMAWRLPHYQSVMRDRVIALQRDHQDDAPQPQQPFRAQAAPVRPAAHEPVTEAALSDPVLSKIFSFG
jgi:hypothetical protein